MILEENIKKLLKKKDILLVSHVVLGYPDLKIGMESVEKMVEAGVELIELQIPFSDPQADGPFFTKAQQDAIEQNIKLSDCFEFAEKVSEKHQETNFLFMTYFNIVFQYGIEAFIKKASEVGVRGIILPDLPIEEADEYVQYCDQYGVAPIFMFAPNTQEERMRAINKKARGFVYCQARAGVTGTHTKFGDRELAYIQKCRANTDLPIAFGFGIQEKNDIDFLRGKVDIAICCTQAVRVLAKEGPEAMGNFLKNLRN